MGIIFLIVVIAIGVFISLVQQRTKQHILRNTGISQSDISAGISKRFEKKYLDDFLKENPEFTEETIKDLLNDYTVQIFERKEISNFSEAVCAKMQKDSKLDKMKDKQFKRANIKYYGNSRLEAVVIYADNRDEYEVNLSCRIYDNKITVDKYAIVKGAVIGF